MNIDKLLNPDFKCLILKKKVYVPPHICYGYENETDYFFGIGGVDKCLEQIKKEILKDPNKYIFPVTIQIFEEATGKLLYNGEINKESIDTRS